MLAELASEFGIRAVRLTREPVMANLRFDARHVLRKAFEGTAFRILSSVAARRFGRIGVASADGLFGLHQSGACDEAYLRYLLPRLPEGVFELDCHPADGDPPALQRLMPGYVHTRGSLRGSRRRPCGPWSTSTASSSSAIRSCGGEPVALRVPAEQCAPPGH